MTCPSCGWERTRGCEPVTRRGVTYCSAECAFEAADRRVVERDVVDWPAPRSLQATASRARFNRRWSRSMFREEPELAEDA